MKYVIIFIIMMIVRESVLFRNSNKFGVKRTEFPDGVS